MVLLPWLQEDLSRNPKQLISNCETCMQSTDRINRQSRGCGFEPPAPLHVSVMPWQPPLTPIGYRHKRPSMCAGYLTRLPEVVEVARAHVHWSKGSLQAFCGIEPATDNLVASLEVLDGEVDRLRVYLLTDRSKGGGRD